jgi:hypothetical protein
MKHRIWTEGEGLSWSTITDLLGDDENTPIRLKNCVLDLTDTLFLQAKELRELEAKVDKLKGNIGRTKSNLGSCIQFGKKRLGYDSFLKYLHDTEFKTVSVEIKEGQIEVIEENLTMLSAPLTKISS